MKIIDQVYAEELANELLEINAVVLRPNEPFQWTSGWNSPIYCDNRLTISYPEIRKKIASKFASHIRTSLPSVDVITGTVTSGIPHAAWVADILDKPMAYVRAKAKGYGRGNQIEGGVKKDETTVVIEDLISTGGSALAVADILEYVGAKVPMVCSIFTYGFEVSKTAFEKRGIELFCLTDYSTLIKVALEKGEIQSDEVAMLDHWRIAPEKWPNV